MTNACEPTPEHRANDWKVRHDAGWRIAEVLEKYAGNYPEDVFPADSDSREAIAGTAMRHAYLNAARLARDEVDR